MKKKIKYLMLNSGQNVQFYLVSSNIQKQQNIMIKIASLNTNGIIGNAIFVENLINNNDITFVQEHWLNNHNKYIIKNLCKNIEKVFFFSPMGAYPSKGRPWGGLCWIIKNNIKLTNYETLDERISIIDVKFNVQLMYNRSIFKLQCE